MAEKQVCVHFQPAGQVVVTAELDDGRVFRVVSGWPIRDDRIVRAALLEMHKVLLWEEGRPRGR